MLLQQHHLGSHKKSSSSRLHTVEEMCLLVSLAPKHGISYFFHIFIYLLPNNNKYCNNIPQKKKKKN